MTGEQGTPEPWFVLDSTLTPLRFIFWGSLLLPFDFEIFLRTFRVDLLNDAVGLGLISAGVYRLERRTLPGANRFAMRLILGVALFATLVAASRELNLGYAVLPYLEAASHHLLLGAAILFSRTMRGVARYFQLSDTAALWSIVSILFALGLGSYVAFLYTAPRSAPVSIMLAGSFVVLFLGAQVLFLFATSSFTKEASRRVMEVPETHTHET